VSTAPPPGADSRAVTLARHVAGHDEASDRETLLARALIAERKLTDHLRRELAGLGAPAPADDTHPERVSPSTTAKV
jgi:hypothetical protein